jgi:y4mF family transcriptional regulator
MFLYGSKSMPTDSESPAQSAQVDASTAAVLGVVGLIGGAYMMSKTFASIKTTADVGSRVRQARKTMGLSQEAFADLSGVGRRFISELEAGKPTVEFERVLKVCQSAGIDLFSSQRSETTKPGLP